MWLCTLAGVYVTDRLVYLQLHKTASTHIEHVLADAFGGEKIGKHNRLDFDPGDRLVFGSVRNPWSWYVSLWTFGSLRKSGRMYSWATHDRPRRRGIVGRSRTEITDGRRDLRRAWIEFAAERRRPVEEWRYVYGDIDDPNRFRTWLRMMHDPARAHDLGHDYAGSSIHRIAGLLSFRYLWLFSRDGDAVVAPDTFASSQDLLSFDAEQNLCREVIQIERLTPDLARVLERAGYDRSHPRVMQAEEASRSTKNVSRRHPIAYYYDADSVELVRAREQLVIQRYGYEPPALDNAS